MQTHINRFIVGLGVAFGLVALLLATAVFLRFNFVNIVERIPSADNQSGDGGTMCTMEAKLCPDGSAVGRSGPNCDFAPCQDSSAR
jgi:hypothetical protein